MISLICSSDLIKEHFNCKIPSNVFSYIFKVLFLMQQDTNGFKLIQEILKFLARDSDQTLQGYTKEMPEDSSRSEPDTNADSKLSVHECSEDASSSSTGNYGTNYLKFNKKQLARGIDGNKNLQQRQWFQVFKIKKTITISNWGSLSLPT